VLRWASNAFFEGKKALIRERLWQGQSGIIFQVTSGISPIDAINESFFSNSQEIGIGICNGCIRPGSVTVYPF
jgi:hypothetical protein